MMRRAAIAGLTGLLLASLQAPSSGASARAAALTVPPLATAYSSGQGLFLARGSFCFGPRCVDVAGLPATTRCLALVPGARIVLRTHIPARRILTRTPLTTRSFAPVVHVGARRVWAFLLPRTQRGPVSVLLDVAYSPGGSALFGLHICPRMT